MKYLPLAISGRIILLLLLNTARFAVAETREPKEYQNETAVETRESDEIILDDSKSCTNPRFLQMTRDLNSLITQESLPPNFAPMYRGLMDKVNMNCFSGELNPALVCLRLSGKKIYSCGLQAYCYDSNGLTFKLDGRGIRNKEGFAQWEIFSSKAAKQAFSEDEMIGRVNLSYTSGSQRIWLNRLDRGMLMDKYDVNRPRRFRRPSELCNGPFADPAVVINFKIAEILERTKSQSSFWRDYKEDWDQSLSFLKGESSGFKTATWDLLSALAQKDTWIGMGKTLKGAARACYETHNGNEVKWIGCMTIKFGKTMSDAISEAAKECAQSVSGPNSSPEKAGECIGKVIGAAVATATGTKGLASAVKATRSSKSAIGKAAGNTAQTLAKCVGEVCGWIAGETELSFASKTGIKSAAKTGIRAPMVAEAAKNLDQSVKGGRQDNVENFAHPQFRKSERESEGGFDNIEKLVKVKNDRKWGESREDSLKRQKLNTERLSQGKKVALGFGEIGVRDESLIVSFLNDKSWTTESLVGVEMVLLKSKKKYQDDLEAGEPGVKARANSVRSALAEMIEGKNWEDLSSEKKAQIDKACSCIGLCPIGGAAWNDFNFKNLNLEGPLQYQICGL
jgi:hypothetical protein